MDLSYSQLCYFSPYKIYFEKIHVKWKIWGVTVLPLCLCCWPLEVSAGLWDMRKPLPWTLGSARLNSDGRRSSRQHNCWIIPANLLLAIFRQDPGSLCLLSGWHTWRDNAPSGQSIASVIIPFLSLLSLLHSKCQAPWTHLSCHPCKFVSGMTSCDLVKFDELFPLPLGACVFPQDGESGLQQL